MMRVAGILMLMLTGLIAVGCGRDLPGPVVMDAAEREAWEIRVVEHFIEKNEAFQDSTQSPLRPEDIAGFEGLNYWFPDEAYRFVVPFHAESAPDTVSLQKRRGQAVPYLRRGYVEMVVDGVDCRLWVYGPADPQHGDYLWLPFYDATTGEQTYAGGRYLDLVVAADGTVDVDFNLAYNPLCDYDPDAFNCTLPPEENRLPVPIPAGEKLFRPHE